MCFCAKTDLQEQIVRAGFRIDDNIRNIYMHEAFVGRKQFNDVPSCDSCLDRAIRINAGNILKFQVGTSLVKYWLNYNELALKSLLTVRLGSIVKKYDSLKKTALIDPINIGSNAYRDLILQTQLASIANKVYDIHISFISIKYYKMTL